MGSSATYCSSCSYRVRLEAVAAAGGDVGIRSRRCLHEHDMGSTVNDNDHQQDDSLDPADAGSELGGRRGNNRVHPILGGLVALALVAGGMGIGTTLPDPTASDAYRELDSQKSSVQSQRDDLRGDYEALTGEYDAVSAEYETLRDGIKAREEKVAAREADADKASADAKAAEAAVKKREEAVTVAEQTKAANTIGDGTWTVGTDIEAGTYRSTENVGSSCYWGIYQSGTNGADIVENDIPGGGRPVVALSPGQDFNSTRCGSWEKQP